MLIHHEIPNQWLNCNIVPFPKSGNLEDVGNYRGIALSAIAAKMTNKMILNRIQPHIDPILPPNQNGFRTGRSTTSHILALSRLIEGVKSHNLKAIIIFVDFKKVFDSINRVTISDGHDHDRRSSIPIAIVILIAIDDRLKMIE